MYVSCVFFTKCEILVRNMRRIGTIFTCCEELVILHSVKFAVKHCTHN